MHLCRHVDPGEHGEQWISGFSVVFNYFKCQSSMFGDEGGKLHKKITFEGYFGGDQLDPISVGS